LKENLLLLPRNLGKVSCCQETEGVCCCHQGIEGVWCCCQRQGIEVKSADVVKELKTKVMVKENHGASCAVKE
jgi:hypothetical protein